MATKAKTSFSAAPSGVTTPPEVWDRTNVDLHNKTLNPTIRVQTARATGSGTIIYCGERTEPDEDGELGYSTWAITNHHVVSDAIRVEKEFDPQLGKYITRDYRDLVKIEVFARKNRSTINSRTTADAEIMGYNARRDLALLRFKTNEQFQFVASVLPADQARQVHMYDKVYVVGCGLGQPPFPTDGMLNQKDVEIDHFAYWMASAPGIFGNSGGAVFLGRSLEMIGVTSRVGVSGGMFGGQAVTHMLYLCPPTDIHRFIQDQGFFFLTDSTHTEAQDLKALAEKKADEDDDDDDE